MEFYVDDIYTTVINPTTQLNRDLKQILSARPDGFQFMPKYWQGRWDGYISLYKDRKFPTGLLQLVLSQLEQMPELIDQRIPIEISSDYNIPGYNFRPYQYRAIEAVLQYKRGILKMATNAGKTLVAAAIIKATGNKAIIIVPSKTLLIQTSKDLEEMLQIDIGRFGDGNKVFKDVIVTTMASLKHVVKQNLSEITTLIIDESHHGKSDQVFNNVFEIPAPVRVGMSGTPLTYNRLFDMKLIAATGQVLYEVTNDDLINKGYSAKPEVRFIRVDKPDAFSMEDYHDAYRTCIVKNEHRNQIIAKLILQSRSKPAIVMVDWIEHLEEICKYVENGVITATGNDPKSKIEDILAEFKNSNKVLICTPIFSEGVNIPSVGEIILAAGGISHIKLLQRIGRGLRLTEDKEELIVYDFIDNTNNFFLKHSEKRYKLYKREGFEVSLQ